MFCFLPIYSLEVVKMAYIHRETPKIASRMSENIFPNVHILSRFVDPSAQAMPPDSRRGYNYKTKYSFWQKLDEL